MEGGVDGNLCRGKVAHDVHDRDRGHDRGCGCDRVGESVEDAQSAGSYAGTVLAQGDDDDAQHGDQDRGKDHEGEVDETDDYNQA